MVYTYRAILSSEAPLTDLQVYSRDDCNNSGEPQHGWAIHKIQTIQTTANYNSQTSNR